MSPTRMPTVPVTAGPQEALRLVGVSKVYGLDVNGAATRVTALREVSLALAAGSFTAVMGPSGSGKSTLLQCAAGLDAPTSGQVFVGGAEVPQSDEAELTEFRRERIGFVFQQYNLIPYLTVAQNVALPLRFAGKKVDQRARTALLARLGLAGALDRAGSRGVLDLLREAVDGFGQTVVMVTHDPVAAAWADAVIFLVDGGIVDRLPHSSVVAVAERMTRLETGRGRCAVTGIALASLHHRRTAFTASFLSVFLGSAIVMTFASMLDTAGQPGVTAADRTTLLIVASVVGGWGAVSIDGDHVIAGAGVRVPRSDQQLINAYELGANGKLPDTVH